MTDTPEMPDLGKLLETAQQLAANMQEAQAQAAATEVVGSAGGGLVKVTLTGGLDVRGVTIDPDAVDPDDLSMLEDLVTAALRDALGQVGELQGGPDLGGIDLGGLGGLGGMLG